MRSVKIASRLEIACHLFPAPRHLYGVKMPAAEAAAEDACLVALSVAGSREAFGQIVARYQSLVASIAFSATGSLSQSEDLAQETFLAAWKHLPKLREPARLRAWLSGIARNFVNNAVRRDKVAASEPLESAVQAPAPGPLPQEAAISRQEEVILWRTLEQIPDAYREPLVLFYREHQSIERVAQSLDLREDVVRQRLSRGRKLLHGQVTAFLESALERSSPGAAFTIGVVASLPLAAGSASAATVGAAAVKGSALAKSAWLAAAFQALIGPVAGAAGSYFAVRAALSGTRSPRERAAVLRQTWSIGGGAVIFAAALLGFLMIPNFWLGHLALFTALGIAVPLAYASWFIAASARCLRELRTIRAEERALHPELFHGALEYRSKRMLLGIPLVHIRYAPPEVDARPAIGWIAVGDRALGVLFAMGQFAAGTISLGSVSIGLVSMGAISAGPLSMGGVSLGILALGGVALGWASFGGFAIGAKAAAGAFAVARDFAQGELAVAGHANDPAAHEFFSSSHAVPIIPILIAILCLVSVIAPALVAWRSARQLDFR